MISPTVLFTLSYYKKDQLRRPLWSEYCNFFTFLDLTDLAKERDFQKKIGIIYRPKQICRFTILNSSFEFSRVFCTIEQNISEWKCNKSCVSCWICSKNAQKFKRRVYDSETAYLFGPVNKTNLFLKISDLLFMGHFGQYW